MASSAAATQIMPVGSNGSNALAFAAPHGRNLTARTATVQPGQTVVVQFNEDKHYFVTIKSGDGTVRLDRSVVNLRDFIGLSYGAMYEVRTDKEGGPVPSSVFGKRTASGHRMTNMHRIADNAEVFAGVDETKVAEDGNDNRNITDTAKNQGMNQEKINAMRAEGTSGADIMTALVAGSSTFAQKTGFSQAKYLKKKQQKYLPRLRILWPTAQVVCEAYYSKHPEKIHYLRVDTLGPMLCMANVHAGAVAITYDETMGMVVGAVAERQQGHSHILNFYPGQNPIVSVLQYFNLSPETASSILNIPITLLATAAPHGMEPAAPRLVDSAGMIRESLEAHELAAQVRMEERIKLQEAEAVEAAAAAAAAGGGSDAAVAPMDQGKSDRMEAASKNGFGREGRVRQKPSHHLGKCRVDEGTLQTLIKSGGDSLIVAVKDDPKHAFHLLRPYLRHSRPFVVYCPHIQPLAQLYHELVSAPDRERVAINMQLTESWAREYQGSASAAPQAPAAAAAPAAPESSEGPAAKRAKSE